MKKDQHTIEVECHRHLTRTSSNSTMQRNSIPSPWCSTILPLISFYVFESHNTNQVCPNRKLFLLGLAYSSTQELWCELVQNEKVDRLLPSVPAQGRKMESNLLQWNHNPSTPSQCTSYLFSICPTHRGHDGKSKRRKCTQLSTLVLN